MTEFDLRYTAEDGARIVAEVRQHPKRDLIRTIAAAAFDLANDDATGSGGGMWWHLSWAYALVEALPALTLAPCAASGKHASPHCACGVNGAGQRYVDPICLHQETT